MKTVKVLLIFALGATVGAGGSAAFFSIKAKKIRKQHDKELAEMDEYYRQKCAECGVEAKEESFTEVEEEPVKATEKAPKRQGPFATPYTEYYSNVDPAEKEHPSEEAERMYEPPKKIRASSFGSNGYSERVLYYSTVDDDLYPEGETYDDMVESDEVKDALGEALDKYGFTAEDDPSGDIYIRYEARKTDYRIIKRHESLSEEYGG